MSLHHDHLDHQRVVRGIGGEADVYTMAEQPGLRNESPKKNNAESDLFFHLEQDDTQGASKQTDKNGSAASHLASTTPPSSSPAVNGIGERRHSQKEAGEQRAEDIFHMDQEEPKKRAGEENSVSHAASAAPAPVARETNGRKHGQKESPDASDDENGVVPMYLGGQEHKIANSKLLALLSKLDKDRGARKQALTRGQGSTQSLQSYYKVAAASVPANPSFLNKRQAINFKFLRGSSEDSPLKRASSAPDLNSSNVTFTVSNNQQVLETAKTALTGLVPNEVPLDVVEKKDEEGQENDGEETDSRSKYRRSSSLKSGKTPPGSPRKRKIVRFADLFGLDLADVKTFMDELPKVPKSAFSDLKDAEISMSSDTDNESGSDRGIAMSVKRTSPARSKHAQDKSLARLQPLFAQPSGTPAMLNNLRDQKVCLESAYVNHDLKVINGTVRVVNIDYHKEVTLRFTKNDWKTFTDLKCDYFEGTSDDVADKFKFTIPVDDVIGKVGGRVQFCIRFLCLGNEYWDSHNKGNYVFQYFAGYQARPAPTPAIPTSNGESSRRGAHTFSQVSNSPTTFSDDPWLRYM